MDNKDCLVWQDYPPSNVVTLITGKHTTGNW